MPRDAPWLIALQFNGVAACVMRRHRHVAPVEVERSLQPRSAFGVGSVGAVVVVVVVVVSVAAGIVLVLDIAGELLVVPAVFVLVVVSVVVWA